MELVSAAIWISSLVTQEADALSGVKDQVEDLGNELQVIRHCLQTADERKELGEDHSLLSQMRQLAFDAEDVIDDFIFEVSSKTQQTSTGPVDWLTRHVYFVLSIPHVWKVQRQIEQILSGLKQVRDNYGTYGPTLLTRVLDRRQKPHSYPYDEEYGDYVVGLEHETLKLLRVLQDNESKTNNNIRGLAIVGIGGSGKTTLARKLYNHPSIKESFSCKAWVSVSQDWSTIHLLSEILRQVSGPKESAKINNGSSVPELVAELRDILRKESYLVVLDDVWEKKALIEMRPVLLCGGGKIIITSRKLEVAEFRNLQCNLHIYEPRPLDEDEAWLLFDKIALSQQTSYNNNKEQFDELGKEMLRKCYGLPLAIEVLAGILYTKESIEEWERVKEAVRSKVMQGSSTSAGGSLEELLALSYDDLPYELKPCFLYLSAFPEDGKIPTGMLTRMWIAEGFVTEKDQMSLEDVAMELVEELRHRFMIQVVRTNFQGIIKVIQLHDLLRDLCVIKAREQQFLQIYTPNSSSATTHASTKEIQSRRAALHSSTSFPKNISKLRSLTLLANSSITYDFGNMHRDFKLLRLLNLWGIRTASGTLPRQIGSLIHLRYLGIHSSNIRQLPSSIGNLRNLLTLDYRNIRSNQIEPVTIPSSLCNLVLLRHLFLPIECAWNEKELRLSTLRNLQVLWGVKCRRGVWFSREMAKLSPTIKKLKVAVSTETDLVAAFNCSSLMLHQLHTFHCEWGDGIVLQKEDSAFHGQHLHKLVLVGKIQVNNFSLMLPSNIVILELKDTALQNKNGEDDNPMVFIGALARLKRLKLSNFYLGSTFICKFRSFPQLEELHLENLNNLEIWSVNEGAMSSLKKLVILYCGKLLEFPQGLPFMASLEKLEYFGVPEEFGQKAIECGWSGERLKLPHNIQAIIRMCDSPVDVSSITKLYEQLTAGVFFRNKWQRYWVEKLDGRYCNCFMLYTTYHDPLIDSRLDVIELHNIGLCKLAHGRWEFCKMEESSSGGSTMVGKLNSVTSNSSLFNVQGRINIEFLTPDTSYEIAFKIKLPRSRLNVFRGSKNMICQTQVLENNCKPLEQEHDLSDKPRDEWIQFSAGPFKPSSSSGYVKFFLTRICVGVMFQGVIIQPKLEAHH